MSTFKRFNIGRTFFYFITLLSTLLILWVTYHNISVDNNDAFGALFTLSMIIQVIFFLCLLVKSSLNNQDN